MVVGFLLIILSIFNVLFFSVAVCLIFTPFYYYSIGVFFIVIVFYLLISIIFFKHTNKQLEKNKDVLRSFELKKTMKKENEIRLIELKFENNKWICVNNENIAFELDNYLFKKSFIIAKVIREIRYPTVSNRIRLNSLLNFKLKINNIDNLVIRFKNGGKTKEYFLVKNHISKNTVLSRAVNKSKYYEFYLSNRLYARYLGEICEIDEKIYLG